MIIVRSVIWLVLILIVVFGSAGRLSYWQGWVYFGGIIFQVIFALIFFWKEPDLLKERVKPGPGTKWWDKILLGFFVPLYMAVMVVGGLDAGRFHWTAPLPLWVYIVSYALFIASSAIMFWAMWVNRFFSSVVRIQTERGHVVVQEGPYRFVRHPGYLAGVLWIVTTCLILGSIWALVPGAIGIILLIVRTYLEDRTLQQELPGYSEYAQKVRFRLLPGIW